MNGTLTVIHPSGLEVTGPNLLTSMAELIQTLDPFHCQAARSLSTHPEEWLREGIDHHGREFKCGGILELGDVRRLVNSVGSIMPMAHNDVMWLPEWLVNCGEVITTQFTPWAIYSLETAP